MLRVEKIYKKKMLDEITEKRNYILKISKFYGMEIVELIIDSFLCLILVNAALLVNWPFIFKN